MSKKKRNHSHLSEKKSGERFAIFSFHLVWQCQVEKKNVPGDFYVHFGSMLIPTGDPLSWHVHSGHPFCCIWAAEVTAL